MRLYEDEGPSQLPNRRSCDKCDVTCLFGVERRQRVRLVWVRFSWILPVFGRETKYILVSVFVQCLLEMFDTMFVSFVLPWAVLGCVTVSFGLERCSPFWRCVFCLERCSAVVVWAGAVLAVLMKKPVGLIWSFWGCLCYFDRHSVECLVDFPPFSEPSGFLSCDWWREGHMTGVSGFSHRLGLSSVRPVDELMLRFVTAWRAEFCDGTTCGVLVGKCIVFEDCALYARPFLSRLAFSTVIGRERTTWQRCLVTGVECWSEGLHWSLK